MTPEEKAYELFDKFYEYADSNYGASKFEQNWHGNVLAGERKVRKQSAKLCALIAVNEMEEVYASAVAAILKSKEKAELFKSRYLQEVKKEIEKL